MTAEILSSPARPGRAVSTLPAAHAKARAAASPCAAVALPSAAAQGVMHAFSVADHRGCSRRSDAIEFTAIGTERSGPLPGQGAVAWRVGEKAAEQNISLTRLALFSLARIRRSAKCTTNKQIKSALRKPDLAQFIQLH